MMYVNYPYCSDHFTIYTHIESLCYIPETAVMLYVNCFSIFLKGRENMPLKVSLKGQRIP